jgi:hypothetical protein
MPFRSFARSQIAGNHLVNEIGESSKMVPTLAVNCRLHSLQRHRRRVLMYCTEAEPQPMRGQATPFGKRIRVAYSCARSSSAKNVTASKSVEGASMLLVY